MEYPHENIVEESYFEVFAKAACDTLFSISRVLYYNHLKLTPTHIGREIEKNVVRTHFRRRRATLNSISRVLLLFV